MSDVYRLYGVPSFEIDTVWSDVEPILKKSSDHSDGTYKTSDVYENIKNKYMQLWVAYKNEKLHACCITQIINYPQEKRLGILFISGFQFAKWEHFFENIKAWARTNGCVCVEAPRARIGWERRAKHMGFKKTHIVLKMNL